MTIQNSNADAKPEKNLWRCSECGAVGPKVPHPDESARPCFIAELSASSRTDKEDFPALPLQHKCSECGKVFRETDLRYVGV